MKKAGGWGKPWRRPACRNRTSPFQRRTATRLHNPGATVTIPDGASLEEALSRITHLSIGAHQDDSEIMAFHGILECLRKNPGGFGAVTCTNGASSPRSGAYAGLSDEDMARVRRLEQEKAAEVGRYGLLIQLDYTSADIKSGARGDLVSDLTVILRTIKPGIVYTHNPFDKHDTHLAVAFAALDALRRLPPEETPKAVYGCEVWRSLDWLEDADKIPLDVSGGGSLLRKLLNTYRSQLEGGKRYDLATLGRQRANATYFQSHAVDRSEALWFAMALTPLVKKPDMNMEEYLAVFLDKFRKRSLEKIKTDKG